METAAGSLRDLRVAEVTKLDMKVEDGKVAAFRTRVSLSFKYEAWPRASADCEGRRAGDVAQMLDQAWSASHAA